jgi:hypothetical protein
MIMDVPTSQHHDGTPRHGPGAHSLWKGVLALPIAELAEADLRLLPGSDDTSGVIFG